MRLSDKKAVIRRYAERYKEFGYHYKTVGWGNRESQLLRFRILSEIGDLNGAEIVDVGCGFGDLYSYLTQRFCGIRYTGIDIVRELIQKGQGLYPKANFIVQDILKEDFKLEADFYLLSGALNIKLRENLKFTEAMIKKMFQCSRKGTGINFLSKYVDYEQEKDFHHSPQAVLTFAKGLTKFVTLRHDYPLWEFTVYLYKPDYINGLYKDKRKEDVV